jgi:type I restriction enzyme M protein
MLTGELRNQIDRIWDAFWTGGISNPLEVIEQITYLLFLRRLDELQTVEELKASRLKKPIERRIFPRAKTQEADLIPICAGRASRTSRRVRCTPS